MWTQLKTITGTIARPLALFVTFTLLFQAQRAFFLAIYSKTIGQTIGESIRAMGHGLAMDMSASGYLVIIPELLAIAGQIVASRWIGITARAYYVFVSVILASVFALDLILYSYWGFRLDMTPLFYFMTSPGAATASAPIWQGLTGIAATAIIAVMIYKCLRMVDRMTATEQGLRKPWPIIALIIIAGLTFIPIRGGITVSTMNLSRAYFSSNPKLNHAAINPAFSLMYSAGHQTDFGSQFQYFDDMEANRLFKELNAAAPMALENDSLKLSTDRPDIYLIILESFSNHIIQLTGGENIAVGLDSIAQDGAMWTNFYANSFRTDRALPAIISGFPSQPTVSLMKYTEKIEKIPTLASELKRQAGYETTYYYGGDANFTNMLTYLVSGGYDHIVSDKDFKMSERMSKWGVHDHTLFKRVTDDFTADGDKPRFVTIQTSSSHEPFEVPFRKTQYADNNRKNSLAYTDSCLTDFIGKLNKTPRKSLVIIVADHYGTWPLRDSLKTMPERHAIPLIMTGTALTTRHYVDNHAASQEDIAPTVMSMLGLDPSSFKFGNPLDNPFSPRYAWISEPEMIGLITDDSMVIYNIAADRLEAGDRGKLLNQAKAYLQTIYSTIEAL